MKLIRFILLFVSINCHAQQKSIDSVNTFYGSRICIDSLEISFKRNLIDSTIKEKIKCSELRYDTLRIIDIREVLKIAYKRDKFFINANISVDLVYYQCTNDYLWMIDGLLISAPFLRYKEGSVLVKKRYIWVEKNGKIDWYKREREKGHVDI